MKKILLFFKKFKTTMFLWVLAGLFCVLNSCSFEKNFESEEINFVLPQWPQDYPPLSYWLIEVCGVDVSVKYKLLPSFENISRETIKLQVQKNRPVGITALPVTLNSAGEEISFFKCSGAIYPFDCLDSIEKNNIQMTWEKGFSAFIFQSLYNSSIASGLNEFSVEDFMKRFNWKKLEEGISGNQEKYMVKNQFYNPWLCDVSEIMQKIADLNFRVTVLNLSGVWNYECQENVLSSYIPENEFYKATGNLLISGKQNNLFLLNNLKGILVTGESEKNLSVKSIFLPIFIEDL